MRGDNRGIRWTTMAAMAWMVGCAADADVAMSAAEAERAPFMRDVEAAEREMASGLSGARDPNGEADPPLDGSVVDRDGRPVIGRPVTIVDRRGRTTELLTDEEGRFFVERVAAPYDLAVAGRPMDPEGSPTAYLGLSRRGLRLALDERDVPPAAPAPTPITLPLEVPPCTDAPCTAAVVAASPTGNGGGEVAVIYDASARGILTVRLEHAWTREPPSEGEAIELHALTWGASRRAYGYAFTETWGRPGAPSRAGLVSARRVATSAPVSLRTRITGAWAPGETSLGGELELPGGARVRLPSASGAEGTFLFPRIAGARYAAWAEHRSEVSSSPARTLLVTARAASRPVPPAGAADALLLRAPSLPDVASPSALRWTFDEATLPRVAEVRVAGPSRRIRVWTTERELGAMRLVGLGLGRLEPGSHDVEVRVASSIGTIDDAASERPASDQTALAVVRFRVWLEP